MRVTEGIGMSNGIVYCAKVRYDEVGAKMALARLQRKRSGKRAERRYYQCSVCGHFHLTKMPKSS